jgi:hypothetical protein
LLEACCASSASSSRCLVSPRRARADNDSKTSRAGGCTARGHKRTHAS